MVGSAVKKTLRTTATMSVTEIAERETRQGAAPEEGCIA
jgi:hypothetical protein